MSMDFGSAGRVRSAGSLLILGALLALPALPTSAQDVPAGGCELPLVAPDASEIAIELQGNLQGPGILLTWPEPADALSTCYALIDTAGVPLPIAVTGDYADRFDREILFEFVNTGTVGDQTRNRVVCTWSNVNNARTGRIGGAINLSNAGGVWIRDAGGAWTQRNAGLPPYLPYTNVTGLAMADDGNAVLALTAGSQFQNDPRGVYVATAGGAWERVAADVFDETVRAIRVAMDPDQSGRFAVGTNTRGVYVTSDGGQTFTQWTSNLDPAYDSIPNNFEVTELVWTATRLYVAVRNYGLFISEDDGASFVRLANLSVPDGNGGEIPGYVRALREDPANSDRVVVGLDGNGVQESLDGGQTWQSLNGTYRDLEGETLGSPPTVTSLDTDPADPDHLIAGTLAQGVWVTTDGGANWLEATTPFLDDELFPTKPQVTDIVRIGGQLVALADGRGIGLMTSADGGATWTTDADQPSNRNGRQLVVAGSELVRPTYGAGIYQPDVTVELSRTILPARTDAEYRDLEFGLSLAFGDGGVVLEDANNDGSLDPLPFRLVAQDYQGWIVWRSERGNPDDMAMIGRFDKNNPESCIEGFCGDDDFALLPNCFSERRAACFDFSTPGIVKFYDPDVYNGFTYFYSVTTFDYGNTALVVDPRGLASPLVFPARYENDPQAEGPGNRQAFQVNQPAEPAVDGEEIYVYPNPLRLGSGIVGGEGEEVIWTNLPPQSKIQIFTLAGDRVADLPEEGAPQQGGNIYWIARNDDNRLLASGIYLWRVVMPERGDFWGKLVIIR